MWNGVDANSDGLSPAAAGDRHSLHKLSACYVRLCLDCIVVLCYNVFSLETDSPRNTEEEEENFA